MKRILSIVMLLAFAAYGQQKRIAIINTVDDGEPPVGHSELSHLTDRLREIAVKTLPEKSYAVMTQQSIVAFLGSQEDMVRKCKESEGCLAKLGREISADYIGQGRIGRFGDNLTIKVELYDVGSGNLIGSFTDEASKDIYGLLSAINNKAPDMFSKLSVGTVPVLPPIPEGISGLVTERIDPQVGKYLPSDKSFWAALALDIAGAAFVGYGIYKNSEVGSKHDEYKSMSAKSGANSEFDNDWQKVEDIKTARNVSYVLGSILLAAGIGVHIWF